jgi:hypothetical protein
MKAYSKGLKFVKFEFFKTKSQKTLSQTLELAVCDRCVMNSVLIVKFRSRLYILRCVLPFWVLDRRRGGAAEIFVAAKSIFLEGHFVLPLFIFAAEGNFSIFVF